MFINIYYLIRKNSSYYNYFFAYFIIDIMRHSFFFKKQWKELDVILTHLQTMTYIGGNILSCYHETM